MFTPRESFRPQPIGTATPSTPMQQPLNSSDVDAMNQNIKLTIQYVQQLTSAFKTLFGT